MNEKIILTQEQSGALESLIHLNNISINRNSYEEIDWESTVIEEADVLKELSATELVTAVLIGYEVEPSIEVGDWVEHVPLGIVGKVTSMGERLDLIYTSYTSGYKSSYRLLTQEEIKEQKKIEWWKSHERK